MTFQILKRYITTWHLLFKGKMLVGKKILTILSGPTLYVIFMQERAVSWKSQKQKSITLLNTEAEYVGQTMVAITVI